LESKGGIRGILKECQVKREFYAGGQSEATYGYIKNMLENEKLRYISFWKAIFKEFR